MVQVRLCFESNGVQEQLILSERGSISSWNPIFYHFILFRFVPSALFKVSPLKDLDDCFGSRNHIYDRETWHLKYYK